MRIPLIEDKYADGAGRALARLRQGKVVFQPKLARKLLAIGMVALSLTLAGWLNSGLWSSKAALHSPLNGLACGQPGSGCEVLAQSIANPRSLSKALPDGSFFVGSAGSPSNDLFGEAVAGVDINSSTIFRYTDADGLQSWVSAKPSQLITLFDATFSSFVPFQTGINGVEVMGRDLVYSLAYNAGATNYVDRMRSYTAETGQTFSEVRRIAGGAANPNGPETVIANLARAEIDNNNPDGVLHQVDNLTHRAGDPEYGTNPFGLLPLGNKVLALDAAGNDLYRIHENGRLELFTVFTNFVAAQQPVPTNLLKGPDGKVYATLFRCVNLFTPGAAGAIVEIKPTGGIQAVSFHSLPISATFGPDGYLYVLEYADLFNPQSGRVLKTRPRNYNDFDGRPESDGTVVIDQLNYPIDLEFDHQGRLLVLESAELDNFKANGRILRFRFP